MNIVHIKALYIMNTVVIMNIVHIKALYIMNTVVTSREDILKASRKLVKKGTAEGISIRAVATACGVSVGSIYNYFQSKTDLIAATVESIWADIFHTPAEEQVLCSLELYISWLFPVLFRKRKKRRQAADGKTMEPHRNGTFTSYPQG